MEVPEVLQINEGVTDQDVNDAVDENKRIFGL